MKNILFSVFVILLSVMLYAEPPKYIDVKDIYIIKDPYPSKLVLLFNHKESSFLRFVIDSDLTYWYGIHFIESVSNTIAVYNEMVKSTGTANSSIYYIGTNTSNAIYQEVYGGFE